MRILLIVFGLGALIAPSGGAQEATPAPLLSFGAGIHFTASQNGEFPTGASARLWILERFGLEVDLWGREGQPSFTLRAFYRAFENELIGLYAGGGVAFFSQALSLQATLQGTGGLEVRLTSGLVFDVEVGLLVGGTGSVPVTAGVGVHFYFSGA